MKSTFYIYRCPEQCPINKKCFILKTADKILSNIKVLQKCPAKNNKDILIVIGDKPP